MHEIVNVYRRYINVTHCFYGKFVLRFIHPFIHTPAPDKGRQKWILKIYLFFRLKESEMKIIEFLHKYFIKFGELSNKLDIYLLLLRIQTVFLFAFQVAYIVLIWY